MHSEEIFSPQDHNVFKHNRKIVNMVVLVTDIHPMVHLVSVWLIAAR
jgi:hypothetical protein